MVVTYLISGALVLFAARNVGVILLILGILASVFVAATLFIGLSYLVNKAKDAEDGVKLALDALGTGAVFGVLAAIGAIGVIAAMNALALLARLAYLMGVAYR